MDHARAALAQAKKLDLDCAITPGQPGSMHFDHIIPIAAIGEEMWDPKAHDFKTVSVDDVLVKANNRVMDAVANMAKGAAF